MVGTHNIQNILKTLRITVFTLLTDFYYSGTNYYSYMPRKFVFKYVGIRIDQPTAKKESS